MLQQEGLLSSQRDLQALLEATLPLEEIVFAFGYGSGVLTQHKDARKSDESSLIDMIIVVKDAYRFHQQNLKQNPHHYATWKSFGDPAARATWWQRHAMETRLLTNPKAYFIVSEKIKYGVVQMEDLTDDLTHWKYLYLAGRMHKPTVEILHNSSIQTLQEEINLPAALATSLLLLTTTSAVTPTAVFSQIAALSYTGDFRTSIAEDPRKISKLVESPGQLERFHALYENAANQLVREGILSVHDRTWTWDDSPAAHVRLWSTLPSCLKHRVQQPSLSSSSSSLAWKDSLRASLIAIVAPAARYQSMKGLASAGFRRSIKYALRKLSKGILSRQ